VSHLQRFTLAPAGPFSLAASVRFLEGFAPAAYAGAASTDLELAFAVDGHWNTVAVRVEQRAADVIGALHAPAGLSPEIADAAIAQVARILSLDVDGAGFGAVGRADPVVGRLQAQYPGLRPVCFWSPYEAAAWAVIGQRIRIRQAAAIKARLASELGVTLDIDGRPATAFPAPAVLAELAGFPGLTEVKVSRLRGVASAALDGQLDAARLRALPRAQALAELQAIPGIGPFSAELILLRGAGDPDHTPAAEPRIGRAVALAYDLPEPPGPVELGLLSEAWRPYRTWVTLLLRIMLEEETHEIGGSR
jgi:DNA-3-methyladenine glycosylase II